MEQAGSQHARTGSAATFTVHAACGFETTDYNQTTETHLEAARECYAGETA